MAHTRAKGKWVSTDAWRGYWQPANAVAGASDTGTYEDSPAPSNKVKMELNDFRNFLKKKGVTSRLSTSKSSNVFMGKRWVIVKPENVAKAKKLFNEYYKKHEVDTSYIHEAD